jgi:hypothetical protein
MKKESITTWSGNAKEGQKGGQYKPSPFFFVKQGQGVVCWTCEGPHMKEWLNKGKTFTSKSMSLNIEECEHCDVEGHDIDRCYSLHLKLCPSKYNNNKL